LRQPAFTSKDVWTQEQYKLTQYNKLESHFDDLANAILDLVSFSLESISMLISMQNDQTDRLKQLDRQAYSLLLEASKIRGISFAFEEPLFLTWTLERFSSICLSRRLDLMLCPAETIASISQHYLSSFQLVQLLFDEFCDLEADAVASQALLSMLACRPLLPLDQSEHSDKWFDEICAVEVPDWAILVKETAKG
jgi:hypothetical protein